jgi:glycine dehydrogenase subunit 2
VAIPDSSHGTNPASVRLAGYEALKIPSDARGLVDVSALEKLIDEDVAGLMLTNPNTLGMFEEEIERITEAVHRIGGLVYYDGANLNAILGRCRPGDMGFDIVHFNTHKSFSTPHGGGGPGAGPVGVGETLIPYLPSPRVLRDDDGTFRLERPDERPTSIGRLRSFVGNTGVLVRAYAYIRAHGGSGLREVSDDAVLAANYLKRRVGEAYDIPFDRACKHEFVASAAGLKKRTGVRTLDIAKRLIDYGFHPPTIYFPLIVPEALMVEPTETEAKETLDAFCDAMLAIAREAGEEPELLKEAPHHRPVKRLDEVRAAKQPVVKYGFGEHPRPEAEPAQAATKAPSGV